MVGIVIGIAILSIVGMALIEMFPYTSIEDVCFEQTFTPEEYEECLRILRESGWQQKIESLGQSYIKVLFISHPSQKIILKHGLGNLD